MQKWSLLWSKHQFPTPAHPACLIREERWELTASLITQGIPVSYTNREQGPVNCQFNQMSEHLESLSGLNRESRGICMHAELLKARHEQDTIGTLISFDEFVNADYFLFLRGELPAKEMQTLLAWSPWSTSFMKGAPRFLLDAKYTPTAQRIAAALGVFDIETLKQRLRERADRLKIMWGNSRWNQPLSKPKSIKSEFRECGIPFRAT